MIKTVNLQKIFKTEEVQTLALNDVNIEVKEGEFVAIMGPSGCGKSTLLNILGLLDNPTSGEYYLNGTEVSKYTEAQRTNLRKGVIGFVFQSFNLIDELNVYENIELPLLYMGIPATERKRRVETAMERMAIMHRASTSRNNCPADNSNAGNRLCDVHVDLLGETDCASRASCVPTWTRCCCASGTGTRVSF